MLAFTLVSLMLSLFGGVFAAISAFRNFSDIDIQKRCNRMDAHLEDLNNLQGDSEKTEHARMVAKKHGAKMQTARKIWTVAQIFPTIVFLCFAIYMACWALINWDVLTQPQN